MSKSRTITLTGRPPVRILEDNWPVIAKAADYYGEKSYNATRESSIRVRRHADGRTIVYGMSTSAWEGEENLRAGELLAPGEDVIAAIHQVARDIGQDRLAQPCIATLPVEPLDGDVLCAGGAL